MNSKLEKMEAFNCSICYKTFSRSDNLKRHVSSIHSNISYIEKKMYKCNACLMQSTYKNNVIRHLKRVHGIEEYKESASSYEQKSETSLPKEKSSLIFCKSCNLEIATEKFSSHQRSLSHKQKCRN
ncbi:hypothetical protein NQ314_006937 [Rhamnusium bicolor]|uniref:C2H2-type domain-containing protein n=1 Tax=Rhamnusium bicolor TaxID=1586634 RepID=A0AAV8YSU7_9CUCU|nr:hypothetical protein NQ314_006937 [Rhamnusium bicolor]